MVSIGLLVLRVVLGVIFASHGAQKLFGSFGGPGLQGTAGFHGHLGIKPPFLMAVVVGLAEFAGGILNGGYEFNLALAGMALTLLITGAGALSLDAVLGIVPW
jgi:putative oxidoreductase